MPAQKRSQENSDEDPPQNDAVLHDEDEEDEEDAEVEDGDENEEEQVEHDDDGDDDDGDDGDGDGDDDDEEDEEEDDKHGGGVVSDRSPSYTSDMNVNNEEFILVRLSDIRKEVQCPICLGIIRKTRTVMECLHRFCRECIDKSMRMGNNECPACRKHCASRRSLRDDPNYDALITAIYPDIDQYEEEELAFQEDEKVRNKQIQAAIAQTFRRQTEALSRKRRRSQGNYRRRRNYRSEDDDDANGHDGGKDSSSADERGTEPKPKRPKRWRGQPSPAAASAEGGVEENDQEVHREAGVLPAALVGSSEILAWGKGGIRSNTRYGSGSGGNGKHSRSRLSRLNEHLRNLDNNDNELDIQVLLVSLDEQKEPLLQHSSLCGRPALSVGQLCQFISLQTSLPPDQVEILGAKGICSKLSSLSTMQVQSGSNAFETCKDELQVLDSKETLAGLKAATNFTRGHLILAYRQKLSM
ncbi:putative E3 ubiquitin-protein ligase RING1a [Beta vulgaris subsp. vulgaris]|uniref:putative E3 ubiquitin-protein ligase RING1a n=1 Tax=Beta vulgaris subsp. vulgaris TaxID=3555 RepID=UPI002036FAD8|nr:putative E3 ubiquitin-protein ligase RING1a [Beta vulgaris subsp. vulgaris]